MAFIFFPESFESLDKAKIDSVIAFCAKRRQNAVTYLIFALGIEVIAF